MILRVPTRPALFEGAADAGRAALRGAQTREAPPDTILFREGAPARALHVLASGFVKLVQTAPDGARVITRYVRPGETFGTPAFRSAGLYPADAVTLTKCVELQWPAQFVQDLLLRDPRVSVNAIRELEARLRDLESRLRDLSNAPVEQRIAHSLANLVEKLGAIVPDGLEVPFPITRQDLADLTGTTLHTVSRTLSAWESERLIRRGRRRVVVTDLPGLRARATPVAPREPQPRRTHRRTQRRPV